MTDRHVAVIGAGVAGIAAALELANSGLSVYLLEREATIGGHAVHLCCKATDTCATCSACAACEKILEVASRPDIKLLTNVVIQNVSGVHGNFHIKIAQKPTYVDMNRCIACGLCTQACITQPKAIQSPSKWLSLPYVVDEHLCLRFKKEDCDLCLQSCPTAAIRFDTLPQMQELAVDAIIVATGFDVFDARQKGSLGYGRYPNVLSGLDTERVYRQYGALKLANGTEPKDIAFIQCVGSRDESCGNGYCSQVCCKYAMKLAPLIKYHNPEAKTTIFYIDMQKTGKGFSEFYEKYEHSINFVRGIPVEVVEGQDNRLKVKVEDFSQAKPVEEEFDMVILSVGITPKSDSWQLARALRMNVDEFGFFDSRDGVNTTVDGIFLAGACQGPKAIPESMAHGIAAAKMVTETLSIKKTTRSD